ncbi:MAG: branched-chain amino acid aminotransferase [Deltaproteobacteria bacterium]|nr:branched-chain amino acid aminotransferase [Deltaproteobacteria bacterium]
MMSTTKTTNSGTTPPGTLGLPPHLSQLVADFELPTSLGFGQVMAPIMVVSDFSDGQWSAPTTVSYQPLVLDPACKSLHYGQLIFEGMKTFRLNDGRVALFRPELNARRFNTSARRMAMPELPEELFLQAVSSLSYHLRSIVPCGHGESLYLRPLMLATDVGLSLKPASTYKFLVIASPSGAYFASGKVTALIERLDARAAPGGTGAYKVAGNYGSSIRADIKATHLNCQQTLWLDAVNKTHIEEFSGMNFFAVIDGALWTPPLCDSILGGVTRDSVIHLAHGMGLRVNEAPIPIETLLAAIRNGTCTELFACGTAAVISPVHALAERDGTVYELPVLEFELSISLKLRKLLVDIQNGAHLTNYDWIRPVTP